MTRLLQTVTILLLSFIVLTGAAIAGPYTWNGTGANNNWSNPANWDSPDVPPVHAVPPTGADVTFPSGPFPYNVDLDVDVVVGDMVVGTAGGKKVTIRTNKHSLTYKTQTVAAGSVVSIDPGGSMTVQESESVSGTVTVAPASTVTMPTGATGVTVNSGGVVDFGDGATPGSTNIFGGSLTNMAGGTVNFLGPTATGAPMLALYGNSGFGLWNYGMTTATGNFCMHAGTVMPLPQFWNYPGAVIYVDSAGNIITFDLLLFNSGIIHAKTGGIDFERGGTLGGTLQLDSGTGAYLLQGNYLLNSLTAPGPGPFDNNGANAEFQQGSCSLTFFGQFSGSTVVDSGAIVTSPNPIDVYGGSVGGFGQFSAPFVNNFTGSVGPGDSPGMLSVAGAYSQGASGILDIQLGGTTVGTGYDQLNVTGAATLDGTLNVSLINGFVPPIHTAFVVMRYASHSGSFATINLPTLPDGDTLQVEYNATNITLIDPGPVFTISGHIATAGGTSVAGVSVSRNGGVPILTDASGNYSFTNLPAGANTLTPSKAGFTFNPPTLNATLTTASLTAENFTAIPTTFSVSGSLKNSLGAGLATVQMQLGTVKVFTAADGTFTFTNVAPGTYTLAPVVTPALAACTFTPATRSVTVGSADVANQNIVVTFSITGKVTNSTGAGFPNLLVKRIIGASSLSVLTAADGSFIFTNVPSGTGTVAPVITPSLAGVSFQPASYSVTVGTANLSSKNFSALFSISGKVTNSADVGQPGVYVRRTTGAAQVTLVTDANGMYSFPNVPSGGSTIAPIIPPAQAGASFFPASTNVTIANASLTNINFTGFFAVTGKVTNSAGVAMANVNMALATSTSTVHAFTAADGTFSFTSVRSNTYTLTPTLSGKTFLPASRSVTVTNVNVASQNFIGQ